MTSKKRTAAPLVSDLPGPKTYHFYITLTVSRVAALRLTKVPPGRRTPKDAPLSKRYSCWTGNPELPETLHPNVLVANII